VQQAQLDTGVPIVFGVLTTDTVAQALARSGPPGEDKGAEAVDTAVEMARFTQDLWRKSD
jgi:6,7-dimethyl-8-ribityllumazine synthase